jgi:hypothetical protein
LVQEIRIRLHVGAPIERVFDAMSDHERFISDAGTVTRIARAGSPVPTGLGCLREVKSRPFVRFVEEITVWERPSAYEYMIRETSLPLRHHGGRLTFTANGGSTDVEWTTRFEITVPILGTVMEPITKRILIGAFNRFLGATKQRLEHA